MNADADAGAEGCTGNEAAQSTDDVSPPSASLPLPFPPQLDGTFFRSGKFGKRTRF
jgi:hypothetical protein